MKSVDEVQKLKVAELKQELQSRGLDTKGVKAILVDRLLDAIVKEGGDLGNGSLGKARIPDESSTATGFNSSEEAEDEVTSETDPEPVKDSSPSRTTRGRSSSPVKNTAAMSPVVQVPVAVSPKTTTVPTHQASPKASPQKVLAADVENVADANNTTENLCVSDQREASEKDSPAKTSVNPTVDKASVDDPASKCLTAETIAPTNVESEKPIPEVHIHGNGKESIDESKDNCSSEMETSMEVEDSTKSVTDSSSTKDLQHSGKEEDVDGGEECKITRDESNGDHKNDHPNESSMETGSTDNDDLKRKREDGSNDVGDAGNEQVNQQSKKVRLDQYSTVRVLPEDEPDFDEQKILLDWYNSDLNIGISKPDFLKATPLLYDEFPWAYAGVKATYGFTCGKLAFEVKWVENLAVSIDFGDLEAKHVLRVGWSDLHSDLQLGEHSVSYGYGSDGKFYIAGTIQDLEDSTFENGDIISTYLDLDSDPVEIKFTKNGKELPKSIQVPKADIEGKTLFPHVLTRNVSFEVNFGESEHAHPLLENFNFVAKVDTTTPTRIRGPVRPENKSECEFVMLCGLPCSGKTTWAKKEKDANLDKHFNIIGTSSVVDRAVKKTTLTGNTIPRIYESFHMKAGRFVDKLLDIAPTRRRNYILDQSNVVTFVQRRKAAGFEGFKRRRAVVILPNDEEYQKRIQAREQEQGKSVPKSTLLDMKATFHLPEVGDIFTEVEFPELSKEECEELLKKYNKEGTDAGYHGHKPTRGRGGGWHGHDGFRGSRGFRGGGGFRGPRRGFRGGPPPFRFMRGDSRPPRYSPGPARVPRDFTHRGYGSSRGGRGGPPPMPLIPRRAEAPRSAWIRGVPPMNGRGGGPPAPRPYQNYSPRQQYPGHGMRGPNHAAAPPANLRPQQSIWTTGQPGGGGWGHTPARGGYHPQQQQHADPWVQQVPDQGYGQSWGASSRGSSNGGGGAGTWQGYGGQTYGSYGRK